MLIGLDGPRTQVLSVGNTWCVDEGKGRMRRWGLGSSKNSYSICGVQPWYPEHMEKPPLINFQRHRRVWFIFHVRRSQSDCEVFFPPKALGSLIKNATADFTRSGSLWGTFFPSEVVCWLGPSSVSLWTNSLTQNWWTWPHNSWSSTHLKREIKKENFINCACFSSIVKTQGLESIQRNQKLINLHPPPPDPPH